MATAIVVAVVGTAVFSGLVFPLDVLKTRMQMRHEMIHLPHLKWWAYHREAIREMQRMFVLMAHQNYFRLYRVGMVPMFFIGGFNTWFRIGSYEIAYNNELLSIDPYHHLQLRAILFCGSMGAFSQFAMNPMTLIKTRLQYLILCRRTNDDDFISQITSFKIAQLLYKKFGWRAFMIGGTACIPRGFIASASQLVFYEQFKIHFDVNFNTEAFNAGTDHVSYISAIGSGILSSVVTCPFDVVYTRMHTQPYLKQGRGLLYHDCSHAFAKILRYEGAHALFKGLPLIYCKHGILGTVSIVFWDIWKDRLTGFFGGTGTAFLEESFNDLIFIAHDLF